MLPPHRKAPNLLDVRQQCKPPYTMLLPTKAASGHFGASQMSRSRNSGLPEGSGSEFFITMFDDNYNVQMLLFFCVMKSTYVLSGFNYHNMRT